MVGAAHPHGGGGGDHGVTRAVGAAYQAGDNAQCAFEKINAAVVLRGRSVLDKAVFRHAHVGIVAHGNGRAVTHLEQRPRLGARLHEIAFFDHQPRRHFLRTGF